MRCGATDERPGVYTTSVPAAYSTQTVKIQGFKAFIAHVSNEIRSLLSTMDLKK